MYSVYKQIHPPTGVEHSIYCNFFNASEKNLVIAGVNQLSVYRLVEDESQKNKQLENVPESKKKKLECLSTYSLFGNIISMQNVRLTGSPRDSLLLSFSDAKLSVVEYDAATHDLKTLSLHIFEEAEQRGGQYNIQALPVIRVDPDGRCAAMSIYGMKLVVLPFRRDIVIDDLDNPSSSSSLKSPFMSSYIIDLRKLDEKITNVIDFQFLHGYYEPTVLILFEPLQTWAGRVAVRMDTCSIVAISLNVQQRVHPIIWSLNSLPFDCVQVLAIPKPIGGVLVFAVNSLLYLNQSVPPYGVSLNCITETSTAFPLKVQEGVRIALDCAQAALISYDRLVLSLKGGELYVLTLVVDSMRCVRSFHFDKAAASVLTTCMTMCDESCLFLGSRLGNSLVLKYTEKSESADIEITEKPVAEPPPKKRKAESGEMLASDISLIDNLDELEVYGSAIETGTTSISKYSFEVCDNIWNIAPCGQAVMGEPAFLSEEFSSTLNPDLELVTCSGYGKNGALSVLQRSVRPQVVTTFELPGCVNMWTVYSNCDEKAETEKSEKAKKDSETAGEEEEKEVPEKIEGGHAFLILSRGDSSMILQTGQEINELDHSGFSTQNPTVFAGNIGDNRFIIQVSPMGVRLLEGVEQLQHIPLDVGSPIVHCSVADPYAVLLSEDGRIILMTLRQDHLGSAARLAVVRPMVPMTSRIVTMCAYRDLSGLFTTKPEERDAVPKAAQEPKPSKLSFDISLDQSNIEDEDELLYGESDTSVFGSSFDTNVKDKQEKVPETQKKEIQPSHWAVICRETGVLEIFSLPDFKMAYYVKSFPLGQKVLVDTIQMAEGKFSSSSTGSVSDTSQAAGEMMTIKEVLLLGLGYKATRPYLLARVDEDLYIYQAFPHFQTQDSSRLKIRFKKVSHNLLLRERKLVKVKKKVGSNIEEEPSQERNTPKLRYFQDISGYSGVFICGTHPHWLFLTSRGSLRFHPMNIDGSITCFAPFCNINCPRGFLYFNKQGELRICVLPTHLTYDSPWPVRKIPLRCTPHFVAYHTECKIYAVVSSIHEPTNKQPKTTTEEHEYDYVNRDETFMYPNMKLFNCQLYAPSSWEVIPNTRIDIGDFEHVRCLKYVTLGSEETLSGYKGYLVMGTTECYGEEVHSRGRIIIFDIIEVVPEPGQPLTKYKMKIEYDKEQKGPVTAISHVSGFLISAIGQKLYMWSLKESDLVGVAFIDTHIYIHEIVTIKNLIIAADLLMSISLYRYQPEMRVLSLVGRDVKPLEIYTADFLVDNTQLSFVVSDRYKNICIYVYQPETRESHGGTRLLRKADFNVGSHINTMFRIRCRLSDPTMDKKSLAMLEKKHITYFATLDGSIGFLLPISEKVYRRLLMLQNSLTSQIPHAAGLNNKSYRAYTSPFPELYNSHKNILDGELLWKYLQLSVLEKTEIAKRIGTTADQLIDDMIEIDRVTGHF